MPLRFLVIFMLILALVSTNGCSRSVRVEDILASPSQYEGRNVTISEGSTRDAFWLQDLKKGAYKLNGKTGATIWVITTNAPPEQFEVVRTAGTVAANFTIGGRFFEPVILEQSRRLIYHYPGVQTGSSENIETPSITAVGVHIEKGKSIRFSGDSTLPEGTRLQSELYEGEKKLDWWPGDKLVTVNGGKWEITVPLGKDGAPENLKIGPGYSLKIWQKDNPAVTGDFRFDLVGPPLAQTEPKSELPLNNDLSGSQWKAVLINGSSLYDGTYISLYLRDDGSFWGYSGLNTYGGNYTANALSINASSITFLDHWMTALGSSDKGINEQESVYSIALKEAVNYYIEAGFLVFYSADDWQLVRFEKKSEYPMDPASLAGTSWQLAQIDGVSTNERQSTTLIFDVGGSSGRGSFKGYAGIYDYEFSYRGYGDDLIVTSESARRVAEIPREARVDAGRYFPGMSLVANYRLTGGALELYTASGKTLIFKPSTNPR